MIGVKPLFSGEAAEDSTVAFEAILLGADGQRVIARAGGHHRVRRGQRVHEARARRAEVVAPVHREQAAIGRARTPGPGDAIGGVFAGVEQRAGTRLAGAELAAFKAARASLDAAVASLARPGAQIARAQ